MTYEWRVIAIQFEIVEDEEAAYLWVEFIKQTNKHWANQLQ
jgi:hypothetical protein